MRKVKSNISMLEVNTSVATTGHIRDIILKLTHEPHPPAVQTCTFSRQLHGEEVTSAVLGLPYYTGKGTAHPTINDKSVCPTAVLYYLLFYSVMTSHIIRYFLYKTEQNMIVKVVTKFRAKSNYNAMLSYLQLTPKGSHY